MPPIDRLTIRELRRDPDALVLYAIAGLLALVMLAAPDVLWDRVVERGAYLVGVIGLPAIVGVGRYLLRGRAATAQGAVLERALVEPDGLVAVTGDFPRPAGVTRIDERGCVGCDLVIGILGAAAIVAVLVVIGLVAS